MPKSKEKLLKRATQKFRKKDPERYREVVRAIELLAFINSPIYNI